MANQSSATNPYGRNSFWLGIVKAAFIASLIALFLMLGLSMEHHRFFRGGQIDNHGVLKP